MACQQLEKIEEKYPAILSTPEEVNFVSLTSFLVQTKQKFLLNACLHRKFVYISNTASVKVKRIFISFMPILKIVIVTTYIPVSSCGGV